jgi:hypothetical protein
MVPKGRRELLLRAIAQKHSDLIDYVERVQQELPCILQKGVLLVLLPLIIRGFLLPLHAFFGL